MCIILLRQFHFVILMMMSCMLHLVPCSTNITTNVNDNHIEATLYHTDGIPEGQNESEKNIPDIVTSISQPNKLPNRQVCPPIPSIPHAVPNVQNPNISVVAGTTVTYSCDNGYYRSHGSYEIKCITYPSILPFITRTKWENSTLVCQIITCTDPGFVENAVRIAVGFNYASNISYSCNPGYVMSGAPFLHCTQNGVWNRQLPRCDPVSCPKLENPQIGSIVYSDSKRSYKSTATISCPPKYHVEKSVSLSCESNGKWKGSLSRCVENFCLNYATSRSGVLTLPRKSQYSIGATVLATCHDKNRTTIRCKEDGSWELNGFKCSDPGKKFCSVITPLENGRHNGSSKITGYSDGVVIAFYCNPNYYRDGPPWIRCRHGSWTSNKPRCVLHEYGSLSRSPSSSSNQLTVLGTVLFVILFFILIVLSIILHRLRQRHLEKQYWKRYFGNHTYRQSRTNITATCNQEMRFFCQSRSTVPVTDL
ncbi:beta-2-glycoprotein 1 [Tetranychus urticae]|nr:beta-2-glycoprotein 1 [Tetranychus urticae]